MRRIRRRHKTSKGDVGGAAGSRGRNGDGDWAEGEQPSREIRKGSSIMNVGGEAAARAISGARSARRLTLKL